MTWYKFAAYNQPTHYGWTDNPLVALQTRAALNLGLSEGNRYRAIRIRVNAARDRTLLDGPAVCNSDTEPLVYTVDEDAGELSGWTAAKYARALRRALRPLSIPVEYTPGVSGGGGISGDTSSDNLALAAEEIAERVSQGD